MKQNDSMTISEGINDLKKLSDNYEILTQFGHKIGEIQFKVNELGGKLQFWRCYSMITTGIIGAQFIKYLIALAY